MFLFYEPNMNLVLVQYYPINTFYVTLIGCQFSMRFLFIFFCDFKLFTSQKLISKHLWRFTLSDENTFTHGAIPYSYLIVPWY